MELGGIHHNVTGGHSGGIGGQSGGNGNNGEDGDGSNSRNSDIISVLIYFLQISQLLLLVMLYCGQLYIAICYLLHTELAVQYCDVISFSSCLSEALSISKYQLITLNHKRGCFELTCKSVNNGNVTILVCIKGKLCICMDTQLGMVVLNLSMDIVVLNCNNSITMVQNSLFINAICHMLHHQSPLQISASIQKIFLANHFGELEIDTRNKKTTKKCVICNKSNNQSIFWFRIVFQGQHSVVSLHYASDNGPSCTVEIILPMAILRCIVSCSYPLIRSTLVHVIQYPGMCSESGGFFYFTIVFDFSNGITTFSTYMMHQSHLAFAIDFNELSGIDHSNELDSNPVPIQQHLPDLCPDDDTSDDIEVCTLVYIAIMLCSVEYLYSYIFTIVCC